MSVSASLVKELREKTGAGMMDCKKALEESAGQLEAAVDWLRKKGLAAAAKKSGRVAAEGLIAVSVKGLSGAIIELNSETDFVARNEHFQQLVRTVAETALDKKGDAEAVRHAMLTSGKTVADEIVAAVATIGENMNFRRSAFVSVSQGHIASYIHSAVQPGMGKIGVLVALETEASGAKIEELGKQIAMHIAAAKPEALHREQVDISKLDRERAVLKEQAIASGKAPDIAEKMVEGRIRKYYEEVVLLEQ
ncbi:MAG: translation elongation factor Ts, partial [Rickettsiales bacterium]|nr:translation elongation factor Ts [Rickettsiales bacterium]